MLTSDKAIPVLTKYFESQCDAALGISFVRIESFIPEEATGRYRVIVRHKCKLCPEFRSELYMLEDGSVQAIHPAPMN